MVKKVQDNILPFPEPKKRKAAAKKVRLTTKRCENFQKDPDNWGKYLRDSSVEFLCFILSKKGKGAFKVKQRQKGRKGERKILVGYLGDDLAEVRDKAIEVSSLLRKGVDPDNPKASTGGVWTLDGAFRRYMSDRTHKQSTIDTYEYNFNRIEDWHNRDLAEISAKEWRELYIRQKGEMGDVEANRTATIWKAIYNYLIDIDELEVNPVRIPKQVKAKIKPRQSRLSLDEIGKFIELIHTFKDHYKNYYLMLFLMAPRRNELRQLKWEDVNWKQWTITFRDTKNGEDYEIPFGGLVRSILEDQKAISQRIDGAQSEYIFRSPYRANLGPMAHSNVMTGALKENLTGFVGVHDFRRTIADIVHEMDVAEDLPPEMKITDASRVIQLILKHSSSDVTGRHYDNSPVTSLKILRKSFLSIERYVCWKYCFNMQDWISPDDYLHDKYPDLKGEFDRFRVDVVGEDDPKF